MSNKKEVYYKFILPDYDKLTDIDVSGQNPTAGTVKALCDACPSYVITYDQLSAPVEATEVQYENGGINGWSSEKKARIKQYVDDYLAKPKYFDIRNYWDQAISQAGGVSLIVSQSPEVYADSTHGYTKFTSTYNNETRIVYCSLVVSSGNFFYNFNLPEEVLKKANLRDEIVSSRFHSNWYVKNDRAPDPDHGITGDYNRTAYRVISLKLHNDWPSNGYDKNHPENYPSDYPWWDEYSGQNPLVEQEKRVFDVSYFTTPGFQHMPHNTAKSYLCFKDSNGNVYNIRDVYHKKGSSSTGTLYDANSPIIPDKSNATYSEVKIKRTSDNAAVAVKVQIIEPNIDSCYYYIKDDSDNEIPVTRYKYYFAKDIVRQVPDGQNAITGFYLIDENNNDIYVTVSRVVEEYSEISEDLKLDFIDLEVTRRILHYSNNSSNELNYNNNSVNIQPISDIPKVQHPVNYESTDVYTQFSNKQKGDEGYWDLLSTDKTGLNTKVYFDMPNGGITHIDDAAADARSQEYINHPPMPIRYDLLRAALNDRDPYSDCETVLVMWVADSDPLNVTDGNIAGLRALNWEQYAIPISVRCCIKGDNGESYNSQRFLVSYPHKSDNSYYKLHTRRNDVYRQDKFKDAVYLPGLIEYSKDYVLTYQNSSYANNSNVFDIQKYLFQTRNPAAVYARRSYSVWTNNGHQQAYYILVKNNGNTEYSIDATQPICLIGNNQSLPDYGLQFTPSAHLPKNMYHDGEYSWGPFANEDSECWSINDNRFITLFNMTNTTENESYAISQVSGTLTLGQGLRTFLDANTSLPSGKNWYNIYLSSLGISWECNWCDADNLFYHRGSDDDVCFPLGFLDGFIQINGVTYGRNIASGEGRNKVVVGFKNVYDYVFDDHHHFVYDSSTDTYSLAVGSNYEYTAYVMNYPLTNNP